MNPDPGSCTPFFPPASCSRAFSGDRSFLLLSRAAWGPRQSALWTPEAGCGFLSLNAWVAAAVCGRRPDDERTMGSLSVGTLRRCEQRKLLAGGGKAGAACTQTLCAADPPCDLGHMVPSLNLWLFWALAPWCLLGNPIPPPCCVCRGCGVRASACSEHLIRKGRWIL